VTVIDGDLSGRANDRRHELRPVPYLAFAVACAVGTVIIICLTLLAPLR
jgi:hypothetical protein